MIGNAITYPGNSSWTAADQSLWPSTYPFTMAALVRNVVNGPTIVSLDRGSGANHWFRLHTGTGGSAGMLAFQSRAGTGATEVNSVSSIAKGAQWDFVGISAVSATNITIWQGTTEFTDTASTHASGTSIDSLNIGNHMTGTSQWTGDFAYVAIWSVALGVGERNALGEGWSPLLIRPSALSDYVIFRGKTPVSVISKASWAETSTTTSEANVGMPRMILPDMGRVWAHPVAATTTTLPADPGTLGLTGGNAIAILTLDAQPTVVSLIGADAALFQSTSLDAQPGTLGLAGVAAAFKTSLGALSATLSLTGEESSIALDLTADGGTLGLTGAEAVADHAVNAESGALSLAGVDLDFGSTSLIADPGTISLLGANASFGNALEFPADPGSLGLVGASAAAALFSRSDPGALTFAGADADFVEVITKVNAEPGALRLLGGSASFEPGVWPLGLSLLRFDLR